MVMALRKHMQRDEERVIAAEATAIQFWRCENTCNAMKGALVMEVMVIVMKVTVTLFWRCENMYSAMKDE